MSDKVAIGYIRASTREQTLTPAGQCEAIEAWCKREGRVLLAVFVDLGVSGGAELKKRHGLLEALQELPKGAAMVVAKRDRLARDTMVAAMVERMAQRKGASVVSADGTGNGDTPQDMLMRRMVDAFAEYERMLISARTSTALAVKKKRNERVGHIPFGMRLAPDGVHLEANEAEQAVIRLVHKYRDEHGLSYRQVAERLECKGVLPRSGGRWHAQTVRRVANSVAA